MSNEASAGSAPISKEKSTPKVIKRYSNRKLYDTERSKYVTLEEISKMIKAGEEVSIIDNESKEDLTSVTLTQIIFEEEKRGSRMPLAMLRNLIQTGGETLQEFFDRSVKTPVAEIKDTAQKSVEELRHSATSLAESATRSVTEWTDAARRAINHREEMRRAEEFRRAYSSDLQDLEKRLQARLEEAQRHAEAARAEGAAPPGKGELEEWTSGVESDVAALRQHVAQISALIDDLGRVAKSQTP